MVVRVETTPDLGSRARVRGCFERGAPALGACRPCQSGTDREQLACPPGSMVVNGRAPACMGYAARRTRDQ